MPPKKTGRTKAPRKGPMRRAASRKPVAKRAAAKRTPARKPAFGRPGTAGKAEGVGAVRAWMRTVKAEHRPIVERLDALIADVVPDVTRAIKWSTPMYGRPGQGFFASVASFKSYASLVFFEGTRLTPPPPEGEGKTMRKVNVASMADFDEAQFRDWVKQASALKGWGRA